MNNDPMAERERVYMSNNEFKDHAGQCHFPPLKLQSKEIDHVKLGKKGGYYSNMGGKKRKKGQSDN